MDEELSALELEFEWLLNKEVNTILSQLHSLIVECCRRFAVHNMPGLDSLVKTEKLQLNWSSHLDQIKILATLSADNICYADISLRLHKHAIPNQRTIVQNDCQWKLHQIQDASNHLISALNLLTSPPLRYDSNDNKYDFRSAQEMINNVMGCLQRGRNSLIVPKKRTIEELQSSRNMHSLQPPLPNDLAVSFYIQSHKLVCAVYHMLRDHSGQLKFDIFQAETSVGWLSEALVLFTVSLQFCQQLKDKVSVFTQYNDMKCNNKP
ncbi:protein rogdi-like isoform X2 [Oppia nitens]|uniref:protein rogdi-like isoform X2 n=1 Tax=Oppia nitens TaxID=1686743 RepID=UPI0023DB8949|nr:protein rogdi-like isoform X2 [Oppia nitens]